MPLTAPSSFSQELTPVHGGDPYRIFIHRPEGLAPAEGWPLLCLTDGNAVFGTAVDAMRAQAAWPKGTDVGEGIIAAIGYPTSRAYDPYRRSIDLTPPPGRSYPPFTPDGSPARTGGAAQFLKFIADDLLPWIKTQAPIDPRRTSLFGHSFGGLFALYTMFERPELFRTYVAASPSLSWEDAVLRASEEAFFARDLDTIDVRLCPPSGLMRQTEGFRRGRVSGAS